eukprot:5220903-Amphidinium_carterae.1
MSEVEGSMFVLAWLGMHVKEFRVLRARDAAVGSLVGKAHDKVTETHHIGQAHNRGKHWSAEWSYLEAAPQKIDWASWEGRIQHKVSSYCYESLALATNSEPLLVA